MPRRLVDRDRPIHDLIAQNLVRFRLEARLTQAAVASQVGLRVESLRRMERGEARIDSIMLLRLAEVLGHRPEDFYMSEPPRGVPPIPPRLRLMVEEGYPQPPAHILDRMLAEVAHANAEIFEFEAEADARAEHAGKEPTVTASHGSGSARSKRKKTRRSP